MNTTNISYYSIWQEIQKMHKKYWPKINIRNWDPEVSYVITGYCLLLKMLIDDALSPFCIIICNNYEYIWVSFRKNKNSHPYYVLSTVTLYLFCFFLFCFVCVLYTLFWASIISISENKYMNEHCKISCVKYDTSLALLRSMGLSSSSRRVALKFIEN